MSEVLLNGCEARDAGCAIVLFPHTCQTGGFCACSGVKIPRKQPPSMIVCSSCGAANVNRGGEGGLVEGSPSRYYGSGGSPHTALWNTHPSAQYSAAAAAGESQHEQQQGQQLLVLVLSFQFFFVHFPSDLLTIKDGYFVYPLLHRSMTIMHSG